MHIVVTGGIGSGKSTVVKMLHSHLPSFEVVSIDNIVACLYDNKEVQLELEAKFNTWDKKYISNLVFIDPIAMQCLKEIMDPKIIKALNEILCSTPNVICEFPLYFDYNEDHTFYFDYVVSVISNATDKIERIIARDTISEAKIFSIMEAQVSDTIRKRDSDIVLYNTSDRQYLANQIYEALQGIKQEQYILETKDVKVGVISGSFDPITLGHTHVIKTALTLVDCLYILIAHNPKKNTMFNIEERENIVENVLLDFPDEDRKRIVVSVLPSNEMVVKFAQSVKAKFIFRGIRNFIDLNYENEINLVQKKISPDIETVYLMAPRDKVEISSSMIKTALCLDDWVEVVSDYVPAYVLKMLATKRNK